MRVFNEDKTIELKEYDLKLGYLIDDKIVIHHDAEIIHHDAEIIHHEALEGVEGQGHYEVVKEYPNGGKDVKWVIDVPKVEANEAYDEIVKEAYDEIVKEAYDDVEEIKIYIPYTEEELLHNEKRELEAWLYEHDYIGVKIATGRATISDYQEDIALMNVKANRINEIDKILN